MNAPCHGCALALYVQVELASYLMSVHADLEARDSQGNTAIHHLVNHSDSSPHMQVLKVG